MTYNFIHHDSNKEYNNKSYEKDFNSQLEAFKYLWVRNERQSFCYGCKDEFSDENLNKEYFAWRSSLSVGEYYKLKSY